MARTELMFWKREKENQTLKGVAVGSETYDLENVRDLLVGGLGEGNGHVVRDTSVVDCKPREPVRLVRTQAEDKWATCLPRTPTSTP